MWFHPYPQEARPRDWCATWPRWPKRRLLCSFRLKHPLAGRAEIESSAFLSPAQQDHPRPYTLREDGIVGPAAANGKDFQPLRPQPSTRPRFTFSAESNLAGAEQGRRQGRLQRQLPPPPAVTDGQAVGPQGCTTFAGEGLIAMRRAASLDTADRPQGARGWRCGCGSDGGRPVHDRHLHQNSSLGRLSIKRSSWLRPSGLRETPADYGRTRPWPSPGWGTRPRSRAWDPAA